MKKYTNLLFFYVILGLGAGVFHREFTKINGYEGNTVLGTLHTHTLVLGFIFTLILLILDKLFSLREEKSYSKWMILYNVSLVYTLITIGVRGVLEVLGKDMPGLNHIAGLGHALLGVSLVWLVVIVNKRIKAVK